MNAASPLSRGFHPGAAAPRRESWRLQAHCCPGNGFSTGIPDRQREPWRELPIDPPDKPQPCSPGGAAEPPPWGQPESQISNTTPCSGSWHLCPEHGRKKRRRFRQVQMSPQSRLYFNTWHLKCVSLWWTFHKCQFRVNWPSLEGQGWQQGHFGNKYQANLIYPSFDYETVILGISWGTKWRCIPFQSECT